MVATTRRGRRYRTTLGERDVTGLVESMKPRCRFRRRREVAARAVARKTALFFGARPYTGRHPAEDRFRDRLRFAPTRWNDRLDRSSEMTASGTSETSHDVRCLVADGGLADPTC